MPAAGPRLVEYFDGAETRTRWVDDSPPENERVDLAPRRVRQNGRDRGPEAPSVTPGQPFHQRQLTQPNSSDEAYPTDDSRELAAWMRANKVV